MQRQMRLWSVLLWTSLLGVGLLATPAGAQGWIITMYMDKGPATLYLHEQWGAKMVLEGQPDYMIFRADRQQTILVAPTNNSHTVMPWAEVKQHQQMASDMQAQAMQNLPPHLREQMMQSITASQQQMQHMSPQERAQAQQMLQQQMGLAGTPPPPKQIEYKATAERKQINGYDTQRVVKYEDGQPTEDLWVAKVKDWQRLAKAFEQAFQHQDAAHRMPYEQVGGIPIKTATAEVRSITAATLTENDFLPAATSRPGQVMPMMAPKPR